MPKTCSFLLNKNATYFSFFGKLPNLLAVLNRPKYHKIGMDNIYQPSQYLHKNVIGGNLRPAPFSLDLVTLQTLMGFQR